MKNPKKDPGRFYAGFIIPVIIAAFYFTFAAAVLEKAGEYMPMSGIVDKLQKTNGVFNSSLHSQAYWFKKEIYRRSSPDVAVIGSSRVLQFRQDQFSRPFVNLGMMRTIDEEVSITPIVFEKHRPQVLIIGVDHWYFHPNFELNQAPASPETVRITLADMLKVASWLASDAMAMKDVFTILHETSPNAGISGIVRNEGYDKYGSLRYYAMVNGDRKNSDSRFKATIAKFNTGDRVFLGSDNLSKPQWDKFEGLLGYLKGQGIKVILFIPPAAPTIVDMMNKEPEKFAYFGELRKNLADAAKRYQFGYFDFHDPRPLGSSDCEFLDGIHGGEILYNRLLRQMALHNADLGRMVDMPRLEKEIKIYGGNASRLGAGETDFLDLGCKKFRGRP